MNDLELKDLLLTTCPVRPGQEGRAWLALKEKLMTPRQSLFRTLFFTSWRTVGYAAMAIVLAAAIFDLGMMMRPAHRGLVFADSQVPGIYATSFYSHSAQAQVVWLNGMDPATDRPTYLDPTTVIKTTAHTSKSPDRL
jgi:hypothetical protein